MRTDPLPDLEAESLATAPRLARSVAPIALVALAAFL